MCTKTDTCCEVPKRIRISIYLRPMISCTKYRGFVIFDEKNVISFDISLRPNRTNKKKKQFAEKKLLVRLALSS